MMCFSSWPVPLNSNRHVVGTLPSRTVPTVCPLKVPAHPPPEEQTQRAMFVIPSETKQRTELKAARSRVLAPRAGSHKVAKSSADYICAIQTRKSMTPHSISGSCCQGRGDPGSGADGRRGGEGRVWRRASVVPSRPPPWQRILKSAPLRAMQMRC